MRIGLTYDLRQDYLAQGYSLEEAAEFDSPETVDAIAGALAELGHEPRPIGGVKQLVESLARGERWDLVFNIAEGLHGLAREAQVPALLDAYAIPYTFSEPAVLCLALDKSLAKRVVRDAGLPTPGFAVVADPSGAKDLGLTYPLFAKPLAEGTSKGITSRSRVNDPAQLEEVCRMLLARFAQPVLVEEYLPGREFTVGVLGAGDDARCLGAMEVLLSPEADQEVYSFANKQDYQRVVTYALLDDPLLPEIEALAVAAYRVLGCRDAGRVDIRLDPRGRPSFIEINPLAGLHPVHSDLSITCRLLGIPYARLIAMILDSALERLPASQAQRAA